MPAQSQQQQKLFGLALAFKRGEVPASEVSDEIKDIADRMSEKEIEDFAGTKHKNLPKKVETFIREEVRRNINENIPRMFKVYLGVQNKLRKLEDDQKKMLAQFKDEKDPKKKRKILDKMKKGTVRLKKVRANLADIEREYISIASYDTSYSENIKISKDDMEKLHSDGEIEVDGEKVTFEEGKKRFRQQDGIGKAKYTISYHDGKQKHKDGSDFFGIQIFKNKEDLETFRNALLKKGYIEESVNEVNYTDQTGIKSSVLKNNKVSSLIDFKLWRWAIDKSVKLYKGIGQNYMFTDGIMSLGINLNKPYTIVKKWGKVDSKLKQKYIKDIRENGDNMGRKMVNEEMIEIEVDLFKQYNQRKPDRTMPMKVDSKTPLSKLLNHTTFKAMKEKYDYIELHYGDKFLGSAMAGTDNWEFKKGRGLKDTSFRESVNEATSWNEDEKSAWEYVLSKGRKVAAKSKSKALRQYKNLFNQKLVTWDGFNDSVMLTKNGEDYLKKHGKSLGESINEEAITYGIEYKSSKNDRKFKKASLTKTTHNPNIDKMMIKAISKDAKSLAKQDGWVDYRITKDGVPVNEGISERLNTRDIKYMDSLSLKKELNNGLKDLLKVGQDLIDNEGFSKEDIKEFLVFKVSRLLNVGLKESISDKN